MGRRSAKVPYRVLLTLRRQGNNSRAEERASRVYQIVRGAFCPLGCACSEFTVDIHNPGCWC